MKNEYDVMVETFSDELEAKMPKGSRYLLILISPTGEASVSSNLEKEFVVKDLRSIADQIENIPTNSAEPRKVLH